MQFYIMGFSAQILYTFGAESGLGHPGSSNFLQIIEGLQKINAKALENL